MTRSRRQLRSSQRGARSASSPGDPIARLLPVPAGADPDHHLWRNGRRWWVAFTIHRGHVQERVRLSLGTEDVAEARRRRDRLFALYAGAEECRVSLRFAPRRARGAGRAAGEAAMGEGLGI